MTTTHKVIPYARQDVRESDIEAVVRVLKSDYLTQGPLVKQFESLVAKKSSAKFGVSFCNATAALHVACQALEVGPGDVVWTSPNSFVATANCALYCGARVDFVDICSLTYNMSVAHLEAKLIAAEKTGSLPKVVIPVHFSGHPCDMKRIRALADQYGFSIIEDASHAIGGEYMGEPIGSCQYSDISVFSFHPVKIITTGEGGIALTNNQNLDRMMKLYRSHGISRDAHAPNDEDHGGWFYQQIRLGHNYRITDIQCALGVAQLARLDDYIKHRNDLARVYHEYLADLPLVLPKVESYAYSSYHLYVVKIDTRQTKISRRQLYNQLVENGVQVNVHYIPIYWQPYYQSLGFKKGFCPQAETYYNHAITIPLYPTLSSEDQHYIVRCFQEVPW